MEYCNKYPAKNCWVELGTVPFGGSIMNEDILQVDFSKQSIPHFLIIGAQKCGTTSLYNYLIQHPQIIPALSKEVHFLTRMCHSLDVFIIYPSMCFNYLELHYHYHLF